jgi:hypothetical protein
MAKKTECKILDEIKYSIDPIYIRPLKFFCIVISFSTVCLLVASRQYSVQGLMHKAIYSDLQSLSSCNVVPRRWISLSFLKLQFKDKGNSVFVSHGDIIFMCHTSHYLRSSLMSHVEDCANRHVFTSKISLNVCNKKYKIYYISAI